MQTSNTPICLSSLELVCKDHLWEILSYLDFICVYRLSSVSTTLRRRIRKTKSYARLKQQFIDKRRITLEWWSPHRGSVEIACRLSTQIVENTIALETTFGGKLSEYCWNQDGDVIGCTELIKIDSTGKVHVFRTTSPERRTFNFSLFVKSPANYYFLNGVKWAPLVPDSTQIDR